MYSHFSGTISEKKLGLLVLDVNGVGYQLAITESTYRDLGRVQEQAFVHAYQVVRENELSLYGFCSTEERALFLNLLKVSGVGPSLSLQILNQAPLQQIVQSVISGDIAFLTRLKGIGKKTAERIVLELRDRLKSISTEATPFPTNYPEDAYLALLALGLSPENAKERLDGLSHSDDKPEKTDDWIRLALKKHG